MGAGNPALAATGKPVQPPIGVNAIRPSGEDGDLDHIQQALKDAGIPEKVKPETESKKESLRTGKPLKGEDKKQPKKRVTKAKTKAKGKEKTEETPDETTESIETPDETADDKPKGRIAKAREKRAKEAEKNAAKGEESDDTEPRETLPDEKATGAWNKVKRAEQQLRKEREEARAEHKRLIDELSAQREQFAKEAKELELWRKHKDDPAAFLEATGVKYEDIVRKYTKRTLGEDDAPAVSESEFMTRAEYEEQRKRDLEEFEKKREQERHQIELRQKVEADVKKYWQEVDDLVAEDDETDAIAKHPGFKDELEAVVAEHYKQTADEQGMNGEMLTPEEALDITVSGLVQEIEELEASGVLQAVLPHLFEGGAEKPDSRAQTGSRARHPTNRLESRPTPKTEDELDDDENFNRAVAMLPDAR